MNEKLRKAPTTADEANYKEHAVFSDLEKWASFYENFSMSIFRFATPGTRAIANIDSYVYSSIQGTLESIKLVLERGRIGDAFALLRKYHDSVVLNLYTNLYIAENHDATKSFLIQEIVDWLNGRKKLPHNNYSKMYPYLEGSTNLGPLLQALNKDQSYEETRVRCNDHTHYNYFDNVMVNDNQVYVRDRKTRLDTFQRDLENLFIQHLSCIFYLNDHYMASSDYVDSLEVGIEPVSDSQYWVAPFIQDIFTNVIDVRRPDVSVLVKNKTSMHLK